MASEQREVIRTLEMYERMFTLNKYSKQHKSVSMTCKDIRFLLDTPTAVYDRRAHGLGDQGARMPEPYNGRTII